MFATQKGRSNPVRISCKRSEKLKSGSLRTAVSLQLYLAILLRNSSAESLETRITFWRLVWPEAMVTEERGSFKRFAKNSMQASVARPSTGGEVRETFSVSPSSPVMAFFLERGWTLTAKDTALPDSWMGVNRSSVVKMQSRPTAGLRPEAPAGAAAYAIFRCSP